MISDTSLFDFWAAMPADDPCHPADEAVLARAPHTFTLAAGPNPFFGPLRTADVVLLYLSPGLRPHDLAHGDDPATRAVWAHQRTGTAPLPTAEESEPTHAWWPRRVAQFGVAPEAARTRVAVLNIGAYRSPSFDDWPMLAALPSSRASLDWAQGVLFPQAVRGERIVVCLRSARHWGLSAGPDGTRHGEALYVPRVGQSGIMHHGALREAIGAAVREQLA